MKRKTFKGRLSYVNNFHQPLWKGVYAAVANESARISEAQIKAAEFAIKRVLKKNGEFWIRINPNIAVTKKPMEVRMGKGKGPIKYSMARVRPGTILFEISFSTSANAFAAQKLLQNTNLQKFSSGIDNDKISQGLINNSSINQKGEILARKAYKVASSKLPLQTKFVVGTL